MKGEIEQYRGGLRGDGDGGRKGNTLDLQGKKSIETAENKRNKASYPERKLS